MVQTDNATNGPTGGVNLPRTGSDVGGLAMVGLGLLLGGAALLGARRRRMV